MCWVFLKLFQINGDYFYMNLDKVFGTYGTSSVHFCNIHRQTQPLYWHVCTKIYLHVTATLIKTQSVTLIITFVEL